MTGPMISTIASEKAISYFRRLQVRIGPVAIAFSISTGPKLHGPVTSPRRELWVVTNIIARAGHSG